MKKKVMLNNVNAICNYVKERKASFKLWRRISLVSRMMSLLWSKKSMRTIKLKIEPQAQISRCLETLKIRQQIHSKVKF